MTRQTTSTMHTNINIDKEYKKSASELKSFLYRLTCDRELSADIAHDTFLKAIEKKEQFNGEATVKTWLFAIASNLAIDYLRKKNRWIETAQDAAKELASSSQFYRKRFLEINQNSPDGSFEFKEHINFCFTCIAKTLPIEQQIALILKDIYDFKVDEICLVLERPKGTIKHWLFRARKSMNTIFDRRCALINKKGICHQCSELNGLFNPKIPLPQNIFPKDEQKKSLYQLRTKLIKNINPLHSNGATLEDEIMQVLRKAIKD